MISVAFAECEIGEPTSTDVERMLGSYRLFNEDEIKLMIAEL